METSIMSQELSSAQLESTWGKFATESAATATKTKLAEAGIAIEKITLETENFNPSSQLEDTQAIANLQSGAIAGGVLGALIGLFISLVSTNFAGLGLDALKNWQTIHYLSPFLGAALGTLAIGLISGLSGASVPKPDAKINDSHQSKRYLVVVKGTTAETSLAKDIIYQQGGTVEQTDR